MKNLWQFVRYGIVGVLATLVQLIAFYVCASCVFVCLTSEDWAVRVFGFSAADVSDEIRGLNFVICTIIGFLI